MLKRQWTVVAALAIMASQTACYTTRIVTNRAPAGPSYTDRQWFTIAGLANLSGPSGQQCQNGLKMSGVDFLINIGLTVAGGVAGALACSNSGDLVRIGCASGGSLLVPFLLSSRTVEYTCAVGAPTAERPAWMPPATGNAAAPAAPAPEAPMASAAQ